MPDSPHPSSLRPDAGVYCTVADLAALKHRTGGFTLLPRQPVHSILAGTHASRLRGRGLNFEELRRYLPGDDVRTIDWHVTARTRKPHVRVYTEERDRPLLLVVDQRASMFFGSRRAMKSVTAAEAAALGAWRALRSGDRVGGIVFNGESQTEVAPHRSDNRVLRLLSEIVRQNTALTAETPQRDDALNRALERAAEIATHDHLVCVVSDFAGANQASLRPMTRITAHNDVLLAFVSDPLEADLPDAGRVVAARGEERLEIDTGDRSLRSRFRSDFEERAALLERLSRRRQIPVLRLSTAEEVSRQFARALGARLRPGMTGGGGPS